MLKRTKESNIDYSCVTLRFRQILDKLNRFKFFM